MERRLYRDLTVTDRVSVTGTDLDDIPIGANPFHHDHSHMGTDLVRGWMVMHPGFDNKKEPQPLRYMILVNTRTGQRVRVDLEPQKPQLCDIIEVAPLDEFVGGDQGIYKPHVAASGDRVSWLRFRNYDSLTVKEIRKGKLYIRFGNHMVRLVTFIHQDNFTRAWERDTFLDPFSLRVYQDKMAWLDDLLRTQFTLVIDPDQGYTHDELRVELMIQKDKFDRVGTKVALSDDIAAGVVRPVLIDTEAYWPKEKVNNWLKAMVK